MGTSSIVIAIFLVVIFIVLVNKEYKLVSEEYTTTKYITRHINIESKAPKVIQIQKYKPFKLSFKTKYHYIIDDITVIKNR